jgi:hypothetical protein
MRPKFFLFLTIFLVAGLACNALALRPGKETPRPSQPASTRSRNLPFISSGQETCTHHLAMDGDDANSGAAAAPWRTLQFAVDSAQPGATICLHSGAYADAETVTFSHGGNAGAPITVMAAPGESVTIQGGLYVSQGVSYLHIVGMAVTGFRVWGVALQGDNHHILFSRLQVSGGEAGFHFTEGESGQPPGNGPVSDVILEDSAIRDASATAVDCTPGPCNQVVFRRLEIAGSGLEAGFGGDGLGLEHGQDVLVEDCYIHDNGGDGIDLNSRDYRGNVPGILVSRNRVARNHLQGIKLWAGGRMENNLIWGQGINPVMVGKYPGKIEVINNTIAYNMYDPAYSQRDYAFVAAYPEETGSPSVTLVLVDNIFAFNTGPQVGSPTGIYLGPGVKLTESHNLFWSREDGEIQAEFVQGRDSWFIRSEIIDGTWAQISGQGQGDLALDPLFLAGWPEIDARLDAGSPAIDAGIPSGAPEVDIEARPRHAQPDIGAYEAE